MTIQLPAVASLLSRWQLVERSWTETDPIDCAAKPFSDAELIRKFEQWGTPTKGQEYIFDARANSPSRKVQSRVGNVVTRYSSRKMNRRLTTESRKPEFGAVVRYDFDNATCEFYCQPPSVRIEVPTERKYANRTVRTYLMPTKYTPDILRITWYGPYIEEWKTPGDLEKLAERFPTRFFQDSDGTWRCPERERYFGDMGITFCLRSSDENCSEFVAP
jgi:putative transposase